MVKTLHFQAQLLLAICLFAGVNLCTWAQQATDTASNEATQPASLSLFVFVDQVPISGVKVSLNGQPIGQTNDAGRITAQVPVGEQVLSIDSVDYGSVRRQILFTNDEVIQILVNLFSDARTPFVDIESSNPNKQLGLGSPTEQQEDAEPGYLEGVISDAESGEPLAGVRVFVSGTPQEVTTGDDGAFRFELPPGEYALSVLASRFNTRTLEGIPVTSEEATTQNLELTPAGSELPEFVVIVPYVAGSLASVLEERREEAAVADYLGAEQISRAGDGDVASALRRVTGLTLVDGRFIFIRGLGERYSSTTLNGADVPSPDPTRRVVPLDLFPTSIVESIQVQKGYTADLSPDFGGGLVQIRTRSVPESNYLQVEIGGGYNAQTTFKDGLRYEGGGTDIFGFDDGTREISDLLDEATSDSLLVSFNPFTGEGISDEELEAIGESLPAIYDVLPQTIEPNFDFGIAGGLQHDFGWLKIGGQAAFDLSNSWRTTSQIRRTFASSGDDLAVLNDLVFDITERNVDLTGFSSLGAELGENNKITANAMLLRSTTDEAQIQLGSTFEFDTITRVTEIEYEERELQAYQFIGEHIFPWINNSTLDWQYTTASASSDIPDFRSYRYELNEALNTFVFASRADGNLRTYSSLDDSSNSFNTNAGITVLDHEDYKVTLKGGYLNTQKERESQVRRFRFEIRGSLASSLDLRSNQSLEAILNSDFIDPDGFEIEDITSASDTYTADLDNTAFYYGLDLELFGFLRLYGGIREDDFFQEVITFDPFDVTDTPVVSLIDTKDQLPAISAAITLPWTTEVRLGFAETVNRPQFRELTPADFIDPITDNLAIGNPDLVPASIKHYDFRVDKYFSDTEFVSIGAFYKEFDQPIEGIITPGANQLLSFANAESAENFGFEFEFYKSFDFFGGFWENLYTSANFAYIDSTVTISPENATVQTNAVRPLQGQSPFVINAQLGYSNPDNGITATLLYNTAGERIVQVGTLGRPDIFEQPFNQLDFVVRYSFDDWVFRLNMRNLLNDEVEFTQGPETTRLFTRGRQVSLGVRYTWN